MEINWELYKKAEDELNALAQEFKKEFFGSEENKNYFYEVEADAEFTPTELWIKTPYNNYRFNKKLDDTFVFKKDKVEHYVYDIDGKYSFENWKKLIEEAEEDFNEVLGIKDDVIAWLDKNTKRTMKKNVSKLFGSWFGKKEKQASIEYKEEDTQPSKEVKESAEEIKEDTTKEKEPKKTDEKPE